MLSDGELLARYLDAKSEAAFAELVQRHLNVVYFAALRRVGFDAHSANDVTQRVFTDLARKAAQLRTRPSLAGWLHTATRFVAAEIVRGETRRRTHEQEAHAMNEINSPTPHTSPRFDPVLDEVLDTLNDRDRDAVLLHFFEGQSFVEVGAALSLSADAARMRVNRALEQLHAALAKRGVESTAAVLATTLTAQSALSAPAAIAGTIAGNALVLASAPLGAGATAGLGGGLSWKAIAIPATAILTAGLIIGIRSAVRPPAPAPASPGQSPPAPSPAPVAPVPRITPAPAPGNAEVELPEISDSLAKSLAAEGNAGDAPMTALKSTSGFGILSDAEKDLLKTLWAHEQVYQPPPGLVSFIAVPAASPRYPEFSEAKESLIQKGFLRAAPAGEGVGLTPAGKRFAAAFASEIDRRQIYFPALGAVLAPAANFDDLSTPEKMILKQLAVIDALYPPAGPTRYGILQPPQDSPAVAEFTRGLARLLAKGWVNIGVNKGVVFLTDAGRAYCAGQAIPMAEFQIP